MATNITLSHAQASASLAPKLTFGEEVAKFVSTKPLVNVLWLGGYMMFLGGILAWRRRAGIAARVKEPVPDSTLTPEEQKPTPGIRPRRRQATSKRGAATHRAQARERLPFRSAGMQVCTPPWAGR